MAVLLSRAHEQRSREIRARSARERAAKPWEKLKREKFHVTPAPISSRFLCPRPPLLFSAPNQNRHATQASYLSNVDHRRPKLTLRVCYVNLLSHKKVGVQKV